MSDSIVIRTEALLVLAGLILAFSAGTILSFDRRDVGIATA